MCKKHVMKCRHIQLPNREGHINLFYTYPDNNSIIKNLPYWKAWVIRLDYIGSIPLIMFVFAIKMVYGSPNCDCSYCKEPFPRMKREQLAFSAFLHLYVICLDQKLIIMDYYYWPDFSSVLLFIVISTIIL